MDRLSHVAQWMSRPDVQKQIADHALEQRQKQNQRCSKRAKERRKSDPAYALGCSMRSRLRSWAVRRLGKRNQVTRSMETLVSMNWPDFRKHLESQFRGGMSWENSAEWQLDHVIPICRFNLPKELRSCFHWTNIRPVWAEEHRRKSKWEKKTRIR